MWDLIVSVPDHCLSFYFPLAVAIPFAEHKCLLEDISLLIQEFLCQIWMLISTCGF